MDGTLVEDRRETLQERPGGGGGDGEDVPFNYLNHLRGQRERNPEALYRHNNGGLNPGVSRYKDALILNR